MDGSKNSVSVDGTFVSGNGTSVRRQQKLGVINGILDVSRNPVTPLSSATEKVRHQPFQLRVWQNAYTGLQVFRVDNLLVKKHSRVDSLELSIIYGTLVVD